MLDSISGIWDGLMHDVEGFDAKASLELYDKDGDIEGKFSYQMTGKHERTKPVSGVLKGKRSKDGPVNFSGELPGFGMVSFEGMLFEVKHHAHASLAGLYRVQGPKGSGDGAGVAIFWLYDSKSG
jgi:hypothetical protein